MSRKSGDGECTAYGREWKIGEPEIHEPDCDARPEMVTADEGFDQLKEHVRIVGENYQKARAGEREAQARLAAAEKVCEAASWLVFHDVARDRRESLPNCLELEGLIDALADWEKGRQP